MPVMPWTAADHGTEIDGVHAESVREEPPEFKRRYVVTLDNRATMTIGAYTFVGDRRFDGELKQPDGREISFDPKAIADKIIDPLLVPKVEAACDKVFVIDRNYMKTGISEFIDEKGTTWHRAA